jgi:hypothetical protein
VTFSCAGRDREGRVKTLELAVGFLDLTGRCPFLSYLFCGDRGGVDGFHPRLDEISADAPERVRALRGIVAQYKVSRLTEPDPWPDVATAMMELVRDRFGQNHAVEISFDKLWSLDPSRNFQIIEMRPFEMTDTVDHAIAQVRFLWAIAHRIACGEIQLSDSSQERCNPDLMEVDLTRFCTVNRLDELKVDTRALFQISQSRFPILSEVDHLNFRHRLRLGRVETFRELHRMRDGAYQDIFVPYRINFSLRMSRNREHADSCLMSIKAIFVDSYLSVRRAAIDAAEMNDFDVTDSISGTVVRHIEAALLALNSSGDETSAEALAAKLRARLHEFSFTSSRQDQTFDCILHIESALAYTHP